MSRFKAGSIEFPELENTLKDKTFFLVVIAGGIGIAAILTVLGMA